jgi:hypothetical protein
MAITVPMRSGEMIRYLFVFGKSIFMDVLRRSNSPFVSVLLLIVVGLQAITPDLRNLASLNLLYVLCSTTNCSIPHEAPDNQQDEVTGLAQIVQRLLESKRILPMTASEFTSTQSPSVPMSCMALTGDADRLRPASRLYEFGHLLC